MQAGTRLGQYEIAQAIGSGGMGEVYRAVDTKLQRPVAIKLLSNEVADVASRRRFQREAETASSLNHPHIVTVHDAGEHDGRQYLVTEFVDGGTLREWLQQDRPSWRQAVELLAGVADGLAAAHAAGILHRDIKPANILISRTGYAKLADFGLARLIDRGDGPTGPTRALNEGRTEPGIVLGTVAYMSPEQASGKALDARSDIFSFGVVLYEALAGQRPFSGATSLEVLQTIVHAPATPLGANLPVALRLVVEKALEKDPAERYQSMREMVVDLRRVLRTRPEDSREIPTATIVAGTRTKKGVWAAALVLAALVIGGFAGRFSNVSSTNLPTIRQQRLTDIAGMEEMPAISHDGKTLAFIARVNGRRQVFVRLLAKGAPIQITHEDADHSFPRWADENTLIYYLPGKTETELGTLWETLVLSATPPRLIAPSQGEGDVSHTGQMIATFRSDAAGPALVLIERGGKKAEQVIPLPKAVYSQPRWSPDDRRIAFAARLDLSSTEIRVMDIPGPDVRTVIPAGQLRGIAWLRDGSGLVYASSEGSTMAYPPNFTLRTVSLDGKLRAKLPVGDGGYASYVEPDVTADGRLVASRIKMESDILRYPVDGQPVENVRNAKRVTHQTGQVQTPSASPDGKEVAYLSDSGGHANVWVASVDADRPPRQITDEQDPQIIIGIPRWSPKGDRIVYLKQHVGSGGEEWLVNPDGTGQRQLVKAGAGGAFWSHDGEWLYYFAGAPSLTDGKPCTYKIRPESGPQVLVRCGMASIIVTSDGTTGYFSPSTDRQGEIWRVRPIETGTAEPLVTNLQARIPLWPHHYDLSPNDKWLAAPLKDGDTTNLWMISTKDGSLRKVTDFEQRATLIGRQVSWSRDNKYIFAALVDTDADIVLFDGALP